VFVIVGDDLEPVLLAADLETPLAVDLVEDQLGRLLVGNTPGRRGAREGCRDAELDGIRRARSSRTHDDEHRGGEERDGGQRNTSVLLCIRWPSTPQPDCTAMYCTPSTANELGTPVIPELVLNFHSSAPVLASNAQKLRSLVPPRNTRPPPVVRIGPQFMKGNL